MPNWIKLTADDEFKRAKVRVFYVEIVQVQLCSNQVDIERRKYPGEDIQLYWNVLIRTMWRSYIE